MRIRHFQTYSCLPEGPCRAGAPRAGPADPPHLSVQNNHRQYLLVPGKKDRITTRIPMPDEAVGIIQVYNIVIHPSPLKQARPHTLATFQGATIKKTTHGSIIFHVLVRCTYKNGIGLPGKNYHTSTKCDRTKKDKISRRRRSSRNGSSSSSSNGSSSHWQQQAPAADPRSSRIVATTDRSTALVVGMLPEVAQLGCLPETELIDS